MGAEDHGYDAGGVVFPLAAAFGEREVGGGGGGGGVVVGRGRRERV